MKTLSQILVLALFALSSCTSSLYTGGEYDDLYYLPSDQPVARNVAPVNGQAPTGSLKNKDYYDNKYAADTLVADQYSGAIDYNMPVDSNNYNNNAGYDYYDQVPYSSRLRMFYGNYFDPYWRDPFYFDYGYPSFGYSFGYGGFPYYGYGYPYYMNPYGYGYGGYYGDYYGYGYPGYYPGFYGGFYPGFYGGYYGGYYGGFYNGGYHLTYGDNKVTYGRQVKPSNLSSSWNSSVGGIGGRRDSYLYGASSSSGRRTTGNATQVTGQRRVTFQQQTVGQVNRRTSQVQSKTPYNSTTVQRSQANTKPAYNSVNRTYTPSYNNPRMSTRPSYNNSRVNQGATNSTRIYNSGSQGSYQRSYNNVRSSSSGSSVRRSQSPSGYAPSGQFRSNSYRSSGSYSVPSRSSVSRGSYSSGSYSSPSSGSGRSYSGSSSSGSSGSYSSGSSGGGGRSSGGGGGGSSSGRR